LNPVDGLRLSYGSKFALVKPPRDTYLAMAEEGVASSNRTMLKTMVASIFGGAYIGMAGLLALVISGNMGAASASAQSFAFAALFPVSFLLALQSGAQLFTGTVLTMTIGVMEQRVTARNCVFRCILAYLGNFIGCGLLAVVAWYTGMLTAGTADLAVATMLKKCGCQFGHAVVKAAMGAWLLSMGVFLASSASDLSGKMVGVWFPLSMSFAVGFEHAVANMFLLPAGLLSGSPLTVTDLLIRNLIPVTLGNVVAITVIAAAGLSFLHGGSARSKQLT